MIGISHFVLGSTFYTIPSLVSGINYNPLTFFVAGVAALLPDLDAEHSIIKYISFKIGRGQTAVTVYPFKILSEFFYTVCGHRQLLHSFLANGIVFLLALPLLYFHQFNFFLAIVFGYLFHLFGDYLTTPGVPLLFPKKDRFLSPVNFRTGSISEIIFIMLIIIIFIIFFKIYGDLIAASSPFRVK